MTEEKNLRSTLLPLLNEQEIGLRSIAIVAETIAIDARFNEWMANEGKGLLNDEEMLGAVDTYEEARAACAEAACSFLSTREEAKLRDDLGYAQRLILRFMPHGSD